MADKKTELSITIRAVDAATAKIKAINDQIDKATKPARDFRNALSDLKEKSGLDGVISGFKGVGSAVEGLLSKVAVIGGVAGLAVHGLFGLVREFDDLGDTAERVGVTADTLAQLRNAAERAGAPVESLDEGLKAFSQNLGQARANTGRLAAFLEKVSPPLLRQVQAAKSNEEAFNLMAEAMAKLQDPAKRAALAQKAFGDSALAPLLAKGAKGIKELRDEYAAIAPGQQEAADAAGQVDDSLHKLHAATDGVKAALVTGLAPALKIIVDRLREWLGGHRAAIAEWAKNLGEKLPGALQSVVEWLGKAYDKVKSFVDAIGGLKGVAIAAGAILAGPLVGSVASLAASLVTLISRLGAARAGLAGLGGGAGGGAGAAAGGAGLLGTVALPVAAGYAINQATGGSLLDVARAKGVDADNILDLFDKARNGAFDKRPSLQNELMAPSSLRQAIAGASSSAKVTVDFMNMPRGARASTDPTSSADINLNVGYQMLPGLM